MPAGLLADGAGVPTGTPLSDPALIEMISEDPVLRGTKMIAEAWDCDGLYQVGQAVVWIRGYWGRAIVCWCHRGTGLRWWGRYVAGQARDQPHGTWHATLLSFDFLTSSRFLSLLQGESLG